MENEIFNGKSFQDLTQEIYDNAAQKKQQINRLVKEMKDLIKSIDDVVLLAPIIKEYIEVSVKNDEHLVKLAAVLQRIITKSNDEKAGEFALTDDEKADLMDTLHETVNEIQKESDNLSNAKIGL
tara:strand:- start:1633 stop:2007 length:375 start_codon:yes stop_codon:yes gene_type:complete